LTHKVGVDEAAETVLSGVTVIVPVAFTVSQPPVNGMLYVNVPEAVGVPEIVIVSPDQTAVTPAGKPDAVPIPVAPVVVCVMLVKLVLIHKVGVVDAAETVFSGVTVIVPVAFSVSQPPVNGMLYVNVPEAVGVPEIVMVSPDQTAVTPAGKPVAVPIPVAPVVVCVMLVKLVLIHKVGVDEAAETVLSGVTVIVPVAFNVSQPPVNGMLYVNVPDTVGVPEIVMVSPDQTAVTPAGKPVAVPIPVAPVVVCVMLVKAVLIHKVGVEDAAETVLSGVTAIVPVAFSVSQPPINGMLYVNVPEAVGVPEIVIVSPDQTAVTPAGKPVAVPIPVAPVVVCVMLVKLVLTHKVGVDEAAVTVLSGLTVIVPVAFNVSQPPVNGML
jgi:hypothetical protein